MKKILLIAVREFIATVFTKAFIIGLLVLPTVLAIAFIVTPRLLNDRTFTVEGQLAVIDPTGHVISELRLAAAAPASSPVDEVDLDPASAFGRDIAAEALAMRPKLTLLERSADADLDAEKAWLAVEEKGAPHLALAVIKPNAVQSDTGDATLGSYDLYVPPRLDRRIELAVQQSLREAIVNARVRARGLDRALIDDLVSVPRVRSVTVASDGERGTVGGFNFVLPLAFMFLLFMGVIGSGQGLLTTTIEEKSSRVIEVLLSAVSPMQLMAGKLLGHMGVSLLALGLYLGLGFFALTSFSLLGLLELRLILYLFIFFLLAFFTIGSLMMAVGASVNEMREAQSLMMPMMLLLMTPWFLWLPISRDPNSTLAIVMSFLPPINSFGMLLRLASTNPPPAWEVWLSIGVGVLGVLGAVWIAAKVFRVGLLMFGKPPNLATLFKWLRAA
jgi:ABC-2 type transport system permease protein